MKVKHMIGRWVADKDMHPTTNVWGREWMADGGMRGTFFGSFGSKGSIPPPGLHWYFTPEQCGAPRTGPADW